jgi:hypothetical protein
MGKGTLWSILLFQVSKALMERLFSRASCSAATQRTRHRASGARLRAGHPLRPRVVPVLALGRRAVEVLKVPDVPERERYEVVFSTSIIPY